MAEWLDSTFYSFDFTIAKAFNGAARALGGFLTPFSELLAVLGKGGIFLLLLGVLLMLFKNTRRGGLCVLLAIGVGALFTNVAIKNLVARARPYQASQEFREFWQAVGAHVESEYSFPSGHMTVTATSMTAVFLCFNKKWSWIGYVYALLTGLSRIYLGVHYATDVIGGIIVGVAAGTVAYFLVKAIYKSINKNADNKFCKGFLNFSVLDLFAGRNTDK